MILWLFNYPCFPGGMARGRGGHCLKCSLVGDALAGMKSCCAVGRKGSILRIVSIKMESGLGWNIECVSSPLTCVSSTSKTRCLIEAVGTPSCLMLHSAMEAGGGREQNKQQPLGKRGRKSAFWSYSCGLTQQVTF